MVCAAGLFAGLSVCLSPWNACFGLVVAGLCGRHRSAFFAIVALIVGVLLAPELPTPVVVRGGVYQGLVEVTSAVTDTRSGTTATVRGRDGRYRALLPPGFVAGPGDVLNLRAEIVPARPGSPFGRPERAMLRPVGRIEVLSRASPHWAWGTTARRSFTGFIERHGDPVVVGVVQALCFNATAEVGDQLWTDLRRSGTVHIVSASGLHVVIIAVWTAVLLAVLPVPRWAQLLLLGALLVVYAGAAGFRPPIVRSVVMVMVALSAYLFQREKDGLSALGVAALATLLWSPEAVVDPGLQLSFVTVGGLMLFGPVERTEAGASLGARVVGAGKTLILTSLIASVAASPLVALYFGEVSVVSPLANLLVIPVLLPVVVGSLVAWGLAGVSLPLAVGLYKVLVEPLAGWILAAVEFTGRLPFATVATPAPSTFWLILFYGSAILLWQHRVRGPHERRPLTDW